MGLEKIFRLLLVLGTTIWVVSIGLALKEPNNSLSIDDSSSLGLISQNTYFGPTRKSPSNSQLARVQVLIHDSPESAGLEIASVSFNGKDIPLKPRDIHGYRGQGSFQVQPGTYQLSWTVNRSQHAWPRTLSHEETVNIDPRDLWIQISIIGETASIR